MRTTAKPKNKFMAKQKKYKSVVAGLPMKIYLNVKTVSELVVTSKNKAAKLAIIAIGDNALAAFLVGSAIRVNGKAKLINGQMFSSNARETTVDS